MQAYAEGFDILCHADSKNLPEEIRDNLNLPDAAEVWWRGNVAWGMGSWSVDGVKAKRLSPVAMQGERDFPNRVRFRSRRTVRTRTDLMPVGSFP